MFRPEDIQARLRKKPFIPLRIIASEGLQHDVYHPDLVMVGNRDMLVGSPSKKTPTVYDKFTQIALVHVVAIEELQPREKSETGNGPKGGGAPAW
jgi:hypothetical protein